MPLQKAKRLTELRVSRAAETLVILARGSVVR